MNTTQRYCISWNPPLYNDVAYLLNSKRTIDFKGTESELLAQFERESHRQIIASRGGWGATGAAGGATSKSQIEVRASGYTYRSILSDFASAEDSGVVIWEASEQIGLKGTPVISIELGKKPPRLPPATYISLEAALQVYGPLFSLHFTLERDLRPTIGSDLIRIQLRKDQLEVKTADDLYAVIKNKYPGTQIFPDPHNKFVIHIVEVSLNPKSNIMDTPANIQFEGDFAAASKRLHAETNASITEDTGSTTQPAMQHQMVVKSTNEQYRDVLCDFASLKDTPTIIWTADFYHLDNRYIPGNVVQAVVNAPAYLKGTNPISQQHDRGSSDFPTNN